MRAQMLSGLSHTIFQHHFPKAGQGLAGRQRTGSLHTGLRVTECGRLPSLRVAAASPGPKASMRYTHSTRNLSDPTEKNLRPRSDAVR